MRNTTAGAVYARPPLVPFILTCQSCGTGIRFDVDAASLAAWKAGQPSRQIWPDMPPEGHATLDSGVCQNCHRMLFEVTRRTTGRIPEA